MITTNPFLTAERDPFQNPAVVAEKLLYRYGLLSARELTLPDFLCVGFRKAGTTWLFENLHRHPEIYLPPFKNVRYFSTFYHHPLAAYAAVFEAGKTRLKGDFSNSYGRIAPRRLRFMRTVMPEVKLITLLRNPVEREWSDFRHRLTENGLSLETLSESEVRQRLRQSSLYQAGSYTTVLDKLQGIFPPEQLFVGFYDDIAERPKGLLSDVFDFLGVTVPSDWRAFPYEAVIIPPAGPAYESFDPWRGVVARQHQNSAETLPEQYRAFLHKLLQNELRELHRRYGERVEGWLESPLLSNA